MNDCGLELLSEYDAGECQPQNLDVEPERAVLKIVKVKFESSKHLCHRIRVSVVKCRVACHTRTNLIEIRVARVMFHYLIDEVFALGTRTNECHIATEYVPKLWQFVKMMSSQELSYISQTRVIVAAGMTEKRVLVLGIQVHGAEFVNIERSSEASDAFLPEYRRTAILTSDADITIKE